MATFGRCLRAIGPGGVWGGSGQLRRKDGAKRRPFRRDRAPWVRPGARPTLRRPIDRCVGCAVEVGVQPPHGARRVAAPRSALTHRRGVLVRALAGAVAHKLPAGPLRPAASMRLRRCRDSHTAARARSPPAAVALTPRSSGSRGVQPWRSRSQSRPKSSLQLVPVRDARRSSGVGRRREGGRRLPGYDRGSAVVGPVDGRRALSRVDPPAGASRPLRGSSLIACTRWSRARLPASRPCSVVGVQLARRADCGALER